MKENKNKTTIQVALDADVVRRAEAKLNLYGISRQTAINMFYHVVINEDQFPFVPRLETSEDIPNETTRKAIVEAEAKSLGIIPDDTPQLRMQ